jgi:hypothetical protein
MVIGTARSRPGGIRSFKQPLLERTASGRCGRQHHDNRNVMVFRAQLLESRSTSDVSEEARHCTDPAGKGKNGPSGHRIPP